MALDVMRIGSYAVSRHVRTPGVNASVESELVLWADPAHPGQLSGATMSFSDVPATPGSRQGTWLFVLLPAAEFDVWYRLVRHERPVSLHWDVSNSGVPIYAALVTGSEPLGEGVDTSPA
ncbi:hypothetical protein ACFPK1_20270 [Actinomycetospora rhizophila]|uniref:Uncharacterized protein n=1 Tax=Actinomycetospora rhizophila TaxID=1416876 RepID=A0ABV9ZGQ5_9PSEU